MMSMTDTYHHIKDQPIKSLHHQCAGHPKFSMKPLQSLFSLWITIAASPLSALVDRAAFFGFNSKRETARSLGSLRSPYKTDAILEKALGPASMSLKRYLGENHHRSAILDFFMVQLQAVLTP